MMENSANPAPSLPVEIEIPTEIDQEKIFRQIAGDLQIAYERAAKAIELLEGGNTVPFIARYRKEVTGDMDEVVLRTVKKDYEKWTKIEEYKISVLGTINKQKKLTPTLKTTIMEAMDLQTVEDLYLPFKVKFKTLGAKARENGLQPLADLMRVGNITGNLEEMVAPYLNPEKKITTAQEALDGAMDIVSEETSSLPEARQYVRNEVFTNNTIKCTVNEDVLKGTAEIRNEDGKAVDANTFESYFDFTLGGNQLQNYQILALNRAENLNVLSIKIETSDENLIHELKKQIIGGNQTEKTNIFLPYYTKAIENGFKRYIIRSIKREYWRQLTDRAEEHAIHVFSTNLRNLLMIPPIKNRAMIGIDPGFRTGCKVAVIDQQGNYLDDTVIYPVPPKMNIPDAQKKILNFITKYKAYTIAIGNGTASRETEQFIADLLHSPSCKNLSIEYALVSEAGASVYSASELAAEEFPDLDLTVRGAISIARRLQDPLSELIKIDPKSIGVGLYQHDVNQSRLQDQLDAVIEDCVNAVGVDVNTASSKLLEHVSGLSHALGKRIVEYRKEHGVFNSRNQLYEIKGLGAKTFEQCAGFLKVFKGTEPLDATIIHPEAYDVVSAILKEVRVSPQDLLDPTVTQAISRRLKKIDTGKIAVETRVDVDKIKYLLEQLVKPNLDPRDKLDAPILRKDVLSIEDLNEGMIVKGTVRNVVDFGAFVDIGIKYNGLIHRSEITHQFVTNPNEHLAVGEVHDVMIIGIDKVRNRIQLSLKQVPKKEV
ncbi:MAG: RNA-binding transcriptional accessory protein [Promethearchaeota archaeon]|nr:MAG: RNA-binding transcriptional accessory protein [Candidatus Lokiarchaeota archaeon]